MSDASIVWVFFLVVLLGYLVAGTILRRQRTAPDLRPIAGYQAMPLAIDAAVENDYPMHFSFGASALGRATTTDALAAADIIFVMVKRLSFERRLPLVTLADPMSLSIAGDTLRKAYLSRDNLETLNLRAVVWYPQGERSMTFAAGVASHTADKQVSSHLLLGHFDQNLMLISESALRHDQKVIATSPQLTGQAVAYATSDALLIGEELYVGGAYLNPTVTSLSGLLTLDMLRWVVIIFGIGVAVLVNVVD